MVSDVGTEILLCLKKYLKMSSEKALMRKEFCSRFWVSLSSCKEKGMEVNSGIYISPLKITIF